MISETNENTSQESEEGTAKKPSEKVLGLIGEFRDVMQRFYEEMESYTKRYSELTEDEEKEFREVVGRVPMGVVLIAKAHPVEGKKHTFMASLSYPSATSMEDPILEGATDMFTEVMTGLQPADVLAITTQVILAAVRASGISALETSNKLARMTLEEGWAMARLIQAKFQERMQAMVRAGKIKVDRPGADPVPLPEKTEELKS